MKNLGEYQVLFALGETTKKDKWDKPDFCLYYKGYDAEEAEEKADQAFAVLQALSKMTCNQFSVGIVSKQPWCNQDTTVVRSTLYDGE